MYTTHTDVIGAPTAGFLPSQSLLQTSLTEASTYTGNVTNAVNLPDNVLPTGAPAGYAYQDALVIENAGQTMVEVAGWPQVKAVPAAWGGSATVQAGQSVRVLGLLGETGQALLMRSPMTGVVTIRRGWALALTA